MPKLKIYENNIINIMKTCYNIAKDGERYEICNNNK